MQGEGEVKIFHRIMQPWPAVDDRGIDGGSHVVVGSDADIVLMALVCCTPRVYVMPDVCSLPPSLNAHSNSKLMDWSACTARHDVSGGLVLDLAPGLHCSVAVDD